MKEQSHKHEMSKALRGDFERLRERGVATTLAPPDERHALEQGSEPAVEENELRLESPPLTDDVPTDAPAPQPGWLGRLIGR